MQIYKADFSCPSWFSTSAKKLIKKILDPNPNSVCSSVHWYHVSLFYQSLYLRDSSCHCYCPVQRITIAEVINNEWFKKGYQPPRFETAEVNLDDINSIFNESGVSISSPCYINMCSNAVDGLGNIVSYDPRPKTTCCQEM